MEEYESSGNSTETDPQRQKGPHTDYPSWGWSDECETYFVILKRPP